MAGSRGSPFRATGVDCSGARATSAGTPFDALGAAVGVAGVAVEDRL